MASRLACRMTSGRRFDAMDAIGQAARAHDADHMLVAGDMFDTEGPEDRTIFQAMSRMGAIPAAGGCCQA